MSELTVVANRVSSTKREAILEIASELFLSLGYKGASVNEMSRRSGISKETFYRYFKSKQELFVAVLDKELQNCGRIQKNFLPRELPDVSGWDIEEFFFPARRVSGDFYDVISLPGGYAGFVIGDVCDKGAGAALFMALTRSLILAEARRDFERSVRELREAAASRESIQAGREELARLASSLPQSDRQESAAAAPPL